MTKKKIMTEEPVQHFGFRKLSVGLVSALVSSTMVTNAVNAHAETTTNVEKTATDESDATSSSKTVTAESGIVVDKASDKAEGDASTSEESATTPDSTKDTEKAKDDQSSATSANDESLTSTESTATTNTATDSAAEAESKVAGDATAASKESTTEGNSQATTSEAKSDTSSTQEDQTSSQLGSKDNSSTRSTSSNTTSENTTTALSSGDLGTGGDVGALVADSKVASGTSDVTDGSEIIGTLHFINTITGEKVTDIDVKKQDLTTSSTQPSPHISSEKIKEYIKSYLDKGYIFDRPIATFYYGIDKKEKTYELINTNQTFQLAYYDVVTDKIIETKTVKYGEDIDFPVPADYQLAAPGEAPIYNDPNSPNSFPFTIKPGIAMPKKITVRHYYSYWLSVLKNAATGVSPLTVPVYKATPITITRTINVHKPDGTIESIKQPVVFKNSVRSEAFDVKSAAFLARDFFVLPFGLNLPSTEKTTEYLIWDCWDKEITEGNVAPVSLETIDTSAWTDEEIEKYQEAVKDPNPNHSVFAASYQAYTVTVSAPKADGTDTWESYTTPTITGYKATLDYVDPVKVKMTDSDVTVDIYYTTDTQKATVTYIDDNTGKELTSDALNGKSNAKSGYTTADKIKTYEGQGYVLVSDDTNGQEIVYDNDSSTDQKYTVHLKHGTVLNSLTGAVNRTINYKMSDGSKAPDSVHDTLTYTANTLVDKVTGEVLSTDWSPAQDFKDVTSPEVAHYVPDRTVVSNKGIAHDHADIVEEVIYTPKNEAQKAKVTYVDETTGKTLKADELNGTSNAKSGYTTAKSIEDYQKLGYVLVSDETSGQEVVFDDDTSKDQEYKVVLKHGYATVTGDNPGKPGEAINPDPNGAKWPDKTDKNSLSEDVHRVITYRMSDSSKAPDQVENVLHFTAKKVVDKVTGEVVSTEWSAPQDFEDVASPAVKGYVADKAVVSNKDIAHDHSDIHEVVTYTPAEQKATVTYVDSLTGKTIMTKELVGKSNAASGYKTEADIKALVDKGYVFESDETNGQEVIFDDDASVDQNYVVKLTHKFEESEETHQATRKIRLHEPDSLKVITQVGNVKRSVKIDSVTGEKTYGDWTQDKWSEFDTPALEGYTASLDKVEEKAVGGDTKDEVVDIYYNKPEEPAPAPQEPEKPAEPVPAEPTPEEPKKPAKPAPEKKEAPAKPKVKMKTTVVTTTQAQLPQTGNKDDTTIKTSGVLALGASLMATLFSSFKKKAK